MRTSRPIFESIERKTVSGAISVAPPSIARVLRRRCIAASARASWMRSLTPIASSSSARKHARRQTVARGDFDEIGEIIFARGVVGADRLQHRQRAGARERDRTRVAAADRALLSARVFLLADRDQRAVALDQPAIAGRIGGLEAQRDEPCPLGEPGAQRRQRLGADQRQIRIADDDVVAAAGERLARGQNRMGGAAALGLHKNLALAARCGAPRPPVPRRSARRRPRSGPRRRRPAPPARARASIGRRPRAAAWRAPSASACPRRRRAARRGRYVRRARKHQRRSCRSPGDGRK